jgi:hypothetical protein
MIQWNLKCLSHTSYDAFVQFFDTLFQKLNSRNAAVGLRRGDAVIAVTLDCEGVLQQHAGVRIPCALVPAE